MLENLHRISDLGDDRGVGHLMNRAKINGIDLAPKEEMESEESALHLNPRHLALRAFLDHRQVFDDAHEWLAFSDSQSPEEYMGIDENVDIELSEAGKKAFEEKASEFFNYR